MAEQDAVLRTRADELAALQRRFDALQSELRSRGPGDPETDEALRRALRSIGDDAVSLLAPEAPRPPADQPSRGELVKDRP